MLYYKMFELVHSSTIFLLSKVKECIVVLWRIRCPPHFNCMLFFISTNFLMECNPTRICGMVLGSDVHDLDMSDNVIIKSAPCSLCLIRLLPAYNSYKWWSFIMTTLLKMTELNQLLHIVNCLSDFDWFHLKTSEIVMFTFEIRVVVSRGSLKLHWKHS